ncbi:EF hand [Chlorella sorokiniana]|uniref:EF hand n=1 Tax=Chlorella sorokiniana TaxID=3076 RepID=A0A2P6TVP4_CHLSO|nr:EF hand [Chlorella sorokiniana]|eukprot:PRW58126.1 EF hand [Chlorella sorokiniana]
MAAVGAALAVPLQVVLALSQSHAQAVALAEVASLGRRLQQLVEIRSVNASAGDLAPLHALCADARNQRDAGLAPLVSLLSQTLAAFGRAEAALAAQQAEALAALAAVGRQLAAHAQESGSEARRLAQHPQTLELAIERQLLSSIQAELAQRAQVIAASSGSPGPLPPFAAALEQLKGEAAAALLHLEQQRAQQAAQQPGQQPGPSEQQPGQQQAQQMQHRPQPLDSEEQRRLQQQQQHMPPAQPWPAAEVGGGVAQGQPAAMLQGGDAQLLASSMQGLAQQLQQLQAVLVGQQQQWQQQQDLQGTGQPSQQHLQPEAPVVAAAAQAVSAGAPTTQGTPAPSLAALLDSQRDSTSPKAVGRPGSAARPATAGAGGSPLAAAMAAASPVPAAGGSGGAEEQLWQLGGDGLQRKRPASQDAERWQQKRSRFGRESQEQQQQEQQRPSAGLLGLPAFLAGVGALFWVFQGAALTGFLKWWRFGPRNDVEAALRFLKAFFRYRAVRLGDRMPCSDRKLVYLANHRGWADFFVDMFVTGARAVPLSRRAVGMAFPAFTSSLLAIRSILLFNRAGVRDTEKFNRWLDEELSQGPQNSLLVYPEGTRSLKDESLPLKRGMLRYAHTRQLPVQVVITAGKEQVLTERRRSMHFGRTLVTGCSEVVESKDHEDFEQFMAAVQALWDDTWAKVHAASPEGLPELEPSFLRMRYSPAQLAGQSLALAGWAAVLATICSLAFFAALAVAVLPGGALLLAALAVWVAASLAAAARPPVPRRGGDAAAASGGAGGKED